MKDRVLKASLGFQLGESDDVVFVDSIDEDYTERHSVGNNTSTPPTSPFTGKNVDECWALLKRLRAETDTQIAQGVFAILDERSLSDDSALIVEADEDEGASSVRITFELVAARLGQYFIGDAGIDEDIEEAAETEDGVVRGS